MDETTEHEPWAAKPHALKLGWVMTSQGLRMRWTLRPELLNSQLGDGSQEARPRPAADTRAA